MFRKSLLAVMVFAAMPLIAATDKTIYVTTLVDENGENTSACSLREALKAASTNRAYGGCIAGQVSGTDKILLKNIQKGIGNIYTLKDTLKIESNVSITGEDAFSYDKPDTVNNTYPGRTALKTIIEGNNSFPLFDSSVSRSGFSLTSIILKKGRSNTHGGAIRAGGMVTLNRVHILDSSAAESGGAIYLEGKDSGLSISDSLISGNKASRGAVLSMSCIDNMGWTERSITVERTAIVENGSASALNIIEFCGTPTATITASTIAKNITSSNNQSAIIKYKHDQDINTQVYVLHTSSSLVLNSNTIVQNTSTSTLLYDNVGKLSLSYNVLAYNNGGLSCRYRAIGGNPETLDKSLLKMSLNHNAIKKPKTTSINSSDDSCSVPKEVYGVAGTPDEGKNLDIKEIDIKDLLYDLKDYNENSGFLPVYLPIERSLIGLVNAADNGNCSTFDQRGLTRNTALSFGGTSAKENSNKCDIGAIEISKLKAGDFAGIANSSYSARIKEYENGIDFYQELIKNPSTEDMYLTYYEDLLKDDKKFFQEFKNRPAKTPAEKKLVYHFRQAYISVFPTSFEYEKLTVENKIINSQFLKFADDKYDVKTLALGSGGQEFLEGEKKTTDGKDIILPGQENIVCEWNKNLKQVIVRRVTRDKNGNEIDHPTQSYETPAGQFEYCKYTINLRSNPAVPFSEGYIQVQFTNVAPVANNDAYTVKYGSNQQIAMDILANDNDDGDGPVGSLGYPTQQIPFFQEITTDAQGNPVKRLSNIRIIKQPELGTLKFEHEQPCPDNSQTRSGDICYGGKLSYVAKNTFSTFDDSFSYKVLDMDLKESNEATVHITNTATTTDDTRSKGGGGAVGVVGVLGLGLLGLLRRRYNQRV